MRQVVYSSSHSIERVWCLYCIEFIELVTNIYSVKENIERPINILICKLTEVHLNAHQASGK